jgi:hypothetical protein
MPRYRILVLTEPVESQTEEFDEYYEHTHLDEVLATTGWQSAQRYRLAGQAGESCPLPYLAEYEAHANSADEVLDQLNSTRSQRVQSDALNYRTGRIWVFEETGPMHTTG